MEKSYTNIAYFFIGILLCTFIGFHRTYVIHFPDFKGFSFVQHFHGLMLMAWYGMLILQPLLIKYKKQALHRQIGKLGYVLAPLVCYSIFLVTKMVYHREIKTRPVADVLGQISLDIPTIFLFGLFFSLAMVNRKNSSVHMRYIIATALLMIGPGLGRALIIYFGVPFPVSVNIVLFVSEFFALLFLVMDIIGKRNFKPFLTIFILLVMNHLCWIFQKAGWWQAIAKWFVNTFF
jgi:hypothetical protein